MASRPASAHVIGPHRLRIGLDPEDAGRHWKAVLMKTHPNCAPFSTWVFGLLVLLRFAGPGLAAPTPDRSWTVAEYVRVGMPDPNRLWTAADYRQCRTILLALDRTNRAALPRMTSPMSGAVFQRIVNPTNTQFLAQGVLPTVQRKELLMFLGNSLPSFQDLYKLSMIDPAFHREAIEIHRVHLRALRIAVELDGQVFPPEAGETQPIRFNIVELNPSLHEQMKGRSSLESVVPRGDRFSIVGAYCAANLSRLLPWLGDGARLPEEERLLAVRSLREELPYLWRHILPATQKEILEICEGVITQTQNPNVRSELEAVRAVMGTSASIPPP